MNSQSGCFEARFISGLNTFPERCCVIWNNDLCFLSPNEKTLLSWETYIQTYLKKYLWQTNTVRRQAQILDSNSIGVHTSLNLLAVKARRQKWVTNRQTQLSLYESGWEMYKRILMPFWRNNTRGNWNKNALWVPLVIHLWIQDVSQDVERPNCQQRWIQEDPDQRRKPV